MWDLDLVRLGMKCGVGNNDLAVSPSVLKLPTRPRNQMKATRQEKGIRRAASERDHFCSAEGLGIVSRSPPAQVRSAGLRSRTPSKLSELG